MSNIDIAQIVIDVFKELELHSDTYKAAAFNCIEKYIELNKNSDLGNVMHCVWCGEVLNENEYEINCSHKKGYGCCEQTEEEKDETDYSLFGITDCDPE